jgi:hypothetical protein
LGNPAAFAAGTQILAQMELRKTQLDLLTVIVYGFDPPPVITVIAINYDLSRGVLPGHAVHFSSPRR